ncbi:MAG TPA: YigZ family protein [Clostridiaceae bacterium]|nr:YigZ family protein [Clostridiaceae bacterium]
MKTIKQEELNAEITEKKSKFIANIFYVESVEEAHEKIKTIKRKYYDARHNCYAYSISEKGEIITKASDDGEPSKTAGAPILNIIKSGELINVLVIVTRYFGGILLGTGGLVKAYTKATQEALMKAQLVTLEHGMEIKIKIDYENLEGLKYYCRKNEINIINLEYKDFIECTLEINNDEKDKIITSNNDNLFKVLEYEVIREKNIRKNH